MALRYFVVFSVLVFIGREEVIFSNLVCKKSEEGRA